LQIDAPWPRRRPSTTESRRRSRATRISLAHPRATTRRENRTVLSMWYNDLVVISSIGQGRVNSKASCITFTFFTLRDSTRPETVTDSKVLQMRFSRRPRRLIKRRSLRIPRATSLRLIRRSTTFLVALTRMSPRGSKNSQPGRSWWSILLPLSILDGPRSPLPLTTETTWTLYHSRGSIPW
jgi:hypothetical protein